MKNIISIAAIADIHFGADFTQTIGLSNALKKHFITKLQESPPDIIVIGGDLFDKKLSVNSLEAVLCNEFIVTLNNVFPNTYKLLIRGTRKHDLNQLDIFRPFSGEYFRIYDTVTIDYILGMKILIIPEEYYPDKSVYDKYLKVNEPYDWVFFHGLFNHVGSYAKASNMNKITFSWEDFKDNVSGRVVGGHIHKSIYYKNIDYCNSFDRWGHGEEEDKGYLLYTYDRHNKTVRREFIINDDAFKYVTIPFKDISDLKVDELVLKLASAAREVKSLRVKIEADDLITSEMLHSLLTISFDIPNLKIDKKAQSNFDENAISIEKQKQLEERRNEIAKYNGLSFEEITIKYAKEKLNTEVSESEIKSILLST
jgi:DNA repair exonuclease SbcCD nuclease subunit